jgi:hypothetical protein
MKEIYTLRELIKLKCRECMNDYVDGRVDCEIITCALYALSPYHKLDPMYKIAKRTRPPMSEERKAKLIEALRKHREASKIKILPELQSKNKRK